MKDRSSESLPRYGRGSTFGLVPVFAKKKRVSLTYSAVGYLPIASRTNYLFEIPGNGIYQPGDGNSVATDTALAQYVTPTTGTAAFATAQAPGYAQWAAIYKQYKVRGSVLAVTASPINNTDVALLSVFPATNLSAQTSGYAGISGAVFPAGSEAAQCAYGDSILCVSSAAANNRVGNTIRLKMTTAIINGMTDVQFNSDFVNGVTVAANPALSVGNQDVDLPWSWFIGLSNCINNNFAGDIVLKFEITWDVEFCDPLTPLA
jgi:hypothetical protein